MIQVFKFGGASVKNADAVRNVAAILKQHQQKQLVVVISAMGKTTNALEAVANAYYQQTGKAHALLNQVKQRHQQIVQELFVNKIHPIQLELKNSISAVAEQLYEPPRATYDFIYDQIVSLGELLSTKIVQAYLQEQGIPAHWLDVREVIRTDNTYREGKIDWAETEKRILQNIPPLFEQQIIVTQGFLGGTIEHFTTTLGREGSDYTAAVFSNILDAQQMSVWKDVPGILNADPRLIDNTTKIEQLSYHEAIEMTYYGASVIHPKTIKPIQNKKIPLHVRSFAHPKQAGTIIHEVSSSEMPPVIVIKPKQVLLSVITKDFSFMAEENLSHIYNIFAKYRIKTNLTQNAAISFSACIDHTPNRIKALLDELSENYKVLTNNSDLTLLTIRHYTAAAIEEHTKGRNILLEQKSRQTIQMVVR